jgi:hypothetical protein
VTTAVTVVVSTARGRGSATLRSTRGVVTALVTAATTMVSTTTM